MNHNPYHSRAALLFTVLSDPMFSVGPTTAWEAGRARTAVPNIQMTTPRSPRLSVQPEAAQKVVKQGAESGLLAPCPEQSVSSENSESGGPVFPL